MQITHGQTNRQYYLDWLRVVDIVVVFFYHSVHFFDTGEWSVKNQATYKSISWLMDLLGVWIMPLIFLVSGASIFYAISKTNAVSFIKDKVMKLLVPLVVGIFTFSIMQVYLERISHGQFQGSFFKFIPHYFEGLYSPGGIGNFAFHGMHLWYLLFLFIFTILLMPLFWWFKGKSGSRFLSQLGNILAKPGTLFLFLVPTIIIQNLAGNSNFMENAGWTMVQYPWFFIAGYLIASHQQMQLQIIKMRWIWLALFLLLMIPSLLLHKGPNNHQDILVWFELFSILGFAMKKLNFTNSFLKYSNEAVMPFYILHQNLLLLLGFFVVKWTIPDLSKYMIIATSTILSIMLLYEYLIRRHKSLRIIFGMRSVPKYTHDDMKISNFNFK